jgi:5-methyltetrahydropteroyltriglutamate--homocysteine methyltransferase
MINAAIAGRPADMRITMHLCRGNFRSTFIASGGYEPVADALSTASTSMATSWSGIPTGAGGFELLRFLPKGKTVAGLITSKTGGIEKKDDLASHRRSGEIRPDRAAVPVPAMRLCSTEEGNVLPKMTSGGNRAGRRDGAIWNQAPACQTAANALKNPYLWLGTAATAALSYDV